MHSDGRFQVSYPSPASPVRFAYVLEYGTKHASNTRRRKLSFPRFCRRLSQARAADAHSQMPISMAKKGPTREHRVAVEPQTLRQWRWRDRKRHRRLVQAGIAPPPELLDLPPCKLGRNLMSDAALQQPEHAEARRKRMYRAAVAERKRVEAENTAAALASLAEAAEAREVELQAVQARRLSTLRCVRGLLRASAVLDEEEVVCEIGGSMPCSEPRALLCCGKSICDCCLGTWWRTHGDPTDVNYTTGVHTTNHTTSGRPIKVPMNAHRCPFCQAHIHSVGRALAGLCQ